MACNENVIKNMASEITRNCHTQNVNVEVEFVVYLIELMLLNPMYGKLFSSSLNRDNLELFVNVCVARLTRGDTSLNTLKMQFIIHTNYDKLQTLVDRHLDSIDSCLRPLVSEILDEDPGDDEAEHRKLFRKISIYIILASGLGNPGHIVTLKEGMAALESVFSAAELRAWTGEPRGRKAARLAELLALSSGVRLFNRDCGLGGEGIPDLPFNLVDAGKACLASLSNSLIAVMQRVNSLTTAIEDSIAVQDGTGNVVIEIPPGSGLTLEEYQQMIALLGFNRQYEVFTRRLLGDAEGLVRGAERRHARVRSALQELHAALKYKAAVPVNTVFPLFTKLWQVWRSMQNIMYLVSTVNRLMAVLAGIQDRMRLPHHTLDKMLKGRTVVTDQERIGNNRVSVEERLSLCALKNYDSFAASARDRQVEFLGFCALCLTVGALVPSNMKIGLIKCKGKRYGFCSVKMAARFSKDPERFVNEVLDYARNNPHLIYLLNIMDEVQAVRNVDCLVTKYVPKIVLNDKDIQTEAHPVEEYIDKNYTWDLWEWKKRACQWATIVNCKTHSTQTHYSHHRSEIHCQTVDPRDKGLQTMRDVGINTNARESFLWGLRGQSGDGQHSLNLVPGHSVDKRRAPPVATCKWPCVGHAPQADSATGSGPSALETKQDFYVPETARSHAHERYHQH